ncbi:MAG: hypothetical protein B6D39_03280 [Anaerolineae bacterium UTCFX2]|jgi:hypothetical protein|nr:MAG: hypothetical protein B6D39_03280 [Anaerolineae bacterium UTCFX2]
MQMPFFRAAIIFTIIAGLLTAGNPNAMLPAQAAPDANKLLFLPLVQKNYPPPPTVFGAETHSPSTSRIQQAVQANLYWLRYSTISWAAIEPVRTDPPTYHWETVDEAGLEAAARAGFKTILVVKHIPDWAQKKSGVTCGPIAQDSMDEFSQFVRALVQRYSPYPYYVRYWEFGNEPDVDPSLVPPDSVFGCWGDKKDKYYGGGYYADMLKWAYPPLKEASPDSSLIIGGLLLDCDPQDPPPGQATGCKPAKFFEGILNNQGANYFDVVAFHTYATYYQGSILDEDDPKWDSRGGQVSGKVNFLRQVMSDYGVNKPILMSEVALLCSEQDCVTPGASFLDSQADFVVSVNARAWGLGLLGSVWYTLEESSWRQSGLFIQATPKPGYHALVFMAKELQDATLGSEITQYNGLRGYEFHLPAKRVWILWSPDGVTGQQISLPSGVKAVYDKFGNPLTPVQNSLWVVHPTYIELAK